MKRRGLWFEDAARQARLQAGGIAKVMEQRRDQRGLRWLKDFIEDLRYGVRTLRGPVFTAVTIATLTLAVAPRPRFSLVDTAASAIRRFGSRRPGGVPRGVPGDPPLNMATWKTTAVSRPQDCVLGHRRPRATEDGDVGRQRSPSALRWSRGTFPCAGHAARAGAHARCSDDAPGGVPLAIVGWRYWQAQSRRGASPRRHRRVTTVARPAPCTRPSLALPSPIFWHGREHAVERLGLLGAFPQRCDRGG